MGHIISCPNCKGTGILKELKCPICEGEGQLLVVPMPKFLDFSNVEQRSSLNAGESCPKEDWQYSCLVCGKAQPENKPGLGVSYIKLYGDLCRECATEGLLYAAKKAHLIAQIKALNENYW